MASEACITTGAAETLMEWVAKDVSSGAAMSALSVVAVCIVGSDGSFGTGGRGSALAAPMMTVLFVLRDAAVRASLAGLVAGLCASVFFRPLEQYPSPHLTGRLP